MHTLEPLQPLMAYLDPLSGGMLLQVLAAAAAATFLFFKSQGRRLMGLLGSRKGAAADKPTED